MQSVLNLMRKRRRRREASFSSERNTSPHPSELDPQTYEPKAEDYPTFPPPSPQEILKDPAKYWATVSARKYAAPQGIYEDSSLYALYRLYEFFVLDKVLSYRNTLEWFWRQSEWPICEIPDPKDEDSSRYAFLAGVTYLLVRSFNSRVELGLTRGASSIMTTEEVEQAQSRPQHERPYETVPPWAEHAPPLPETLSLPTHDGITLSGRADERADPDFLAKNILIWTPHIHFT